MKTITQIRLLTLHCLLEYNDNALSKLTISNLHDKYCDSVGWIVFRRVNNIDCLSIAHLLHILTLLHEEQTNTLLTFFRKSFIVNTLYIVNSSLPPSGVKLICESLVPHNVTTLTLWDCNIDDKCVEIICDLLNTTLTHLDLDGNNITDEGVESICKVITQSDSKLTHLHLSYNNITDEGVESICKVMTQPNSKLEVLYLRGNKKITNECKKYLRNLVEQHKPYFSLYT
jgi:Leucine-rich repeat (LRR) protein